MYEALNAVGSETPRLEFKRQISGKGLAYRACTFANAAGGLIVIGVNDPVAGAALEVHGLTDISDRAIRAYNSTINAWTRPQPRTEMCGYMDVAGLQSFLVVRIAQSAVGPTEYLGADERNLPVRDGTQTRVLRLSEIEALQARGDSSTSTSPLTQRGQRVPLIPSATGGDFFFGFVAHPKIYQPLRIMDPADNEMCYAIEERTRGVNQTVHVALERRETLADGVWMHDDPPEQTNPPTPAPNQLEIDSDGHVLVRFTERGPDLLEEYFRTLLTGYAVAQEVFYRFGIAPQAELRVIAHLSGQARSAKVAQYLDHRVEVDLSREHFADAFTTTLMIMFRSAGDARSRLDIRDMLEGASRRLPLAEELHDRWFVT